MTVNAQQGAPSDSEQFDPSLTVRFSDDGPEGHTEVAGRTAFRSVPLIRLLEGGETSRLLVGRVDLDMVSGSLIVEAVLTGDWDLSKTGDCRPRDGRHSLTQDEAKALRDGLFSPRLDLSTDQGASDPKDAHQYQVTAVAKSIAEKSRNSASKIRRARYKLEQQMARQTRDGAGDLRPSEAVAAILELGTAASRARDEAKFAVRSGMRLSETDAAAYHSHRKAMDPALVVQEMPATVNTRPWMRLHDAGIRQCMVIDRELTDEAIALTRLVAAATTMSAMQEARSQETFNTLAGVAAVGLGVPALLLALYSTQGLLPLNTGRSRAAFILVLAVPLLAALTGLAGRRRLSALADRYAPEGSWLRTHCSGTQGAVALFMGTVAASLIFGAVVLGPPKKETSSAPVPVPTVTVTVQR